MREQRWLGFIADDEEIEVVSFGDRKGVLVREKFDKEKWANRIYNTYRKGVTVSVSSSMGYVVCRHKENHKIGYAFCRPTDRFNEKIGIAIAICRIYNLEIPKEIFKD